ncbi:MAG TPA: DUF1080 domain-containing protein [Chitinophagaceae bacterium]|nr:DUF1080 domain-containing protein [Chitinophagaceae bacterium]
MSKWIWALLLVNSTSLLAQTDPAATRVWTPVPPVIIPGNNSSDPPSDAIIILSKKKHGDWVNADGQPSKWKTEKGVMTVVPGTGDIKTVQKFGSCQLHIEWRVPRDVEGEGQNRGNSGVYLMDRYEVQVLDNYKNVTYSNGMAGSIYKQHIPLVNVCRPPGEWQSYDIIFTAPVFSSDTTVQAPAKFTVFQNGVLIQNDVVLKGLTVDAGQPHYRRHADKEPLKLQDHEFRISYRNIWIREL